MAQTSSSDRKKRKYGDKRIAATARNKASKQARHERRQRQAEGRTLDLVGRIVGFGSAKEPQKGTVLEVFSRGEEGHPGGKIRGRYLKVSNSNGDRLVRRKAVKLV